MWRTLLALIIVPGFGIPCIGQTAAPAGQGHALGLGDAHEVVFSTENGAMALGRDGKVFLQSGAEGLWRLKLADGRTIDASQFSSGGGARAFIVEKAQGGGLRLRYRSEEAEVVVFAQPLDHALELHAQVTPAKQVAMELMLPGRLRFDPQITERLICPANGNEAVGFAFKGDFFKAQDQDNPSAWQAHSSGPRGYRRLFNGQSMAMRPVNDPPVALKVTDEGQKWFGPALTARLNKAQGVVNRAPGQGQADRVLVDSAHGAYLSGSRLGGAADSAGMLWRIGGGVGKDESAFVPAMIGQVVAHLASSNAPAGRNRIGLIALKRGPQTGGFTSVKVEQWQAQLAGVAERLKGKFEFVTIDSPAGMLAATADGKHLAIINPYGEQLPARPQDTIEQIVDAIGKYVRGGGNWFEVGGASFYGLLLPAKYYSIATPYPPAFADFFHLRTTMGSAAIYRVQLRDWQPWSAAREAQNVFVPGRIGCGGDEAGGYLERAFGTYIPGGQTWTSPRVRIALQEDPAQALRQYAQANGITRRLEEKMPAERLERFKKSVLVYLAGSCAEKLASLDRVPAPAQIHFADYLLGGFDKQYPDHLPPRESFGTPAQFKEFFDKGHRLGHLMVPYTNPTWWCDEPRGPTFEKHGEAPLLKTLEGKTIHERYDRNTGYTITYWHPAVQAANRLTRTQFVRDYPVDVLFQDQCGARGWQYDTNPASPSPLAYVEGMLSMIEEDSAIVPLSTESGWDRVVNSQVQLCGMTWRIVPTEHGPAWRQLMKHTADPRTWEVYPLAQQIAQDKVALLHHDLGQFITNDEVLSWSLALGYNMSYRVSGRSIDEPRNRQWLAWLDRVQKSICARYVGVPVRSFAHRRFEETPGVKNTDNGVIQAQYGEVHVTANLDAIPRTIDGASLAAHGFLASAPGMIAGLLQAGDAAAGNVSSTTGGDTITFIAEGDARAASVWILDGGEREVAIRLPVAMAGQITAQLADGRAIALQSTGANVRLALPRVDGPAKGQRVLWNVRIEAGK